jgi:hypothetical protein
MLFSEQFNIKYMGDEEWFNPILHQDTLLFIDPFSVFKSKDDLFKDSYSEMMYFFQKAFELIACSGGAPNHLSYKKAESMLVFPEVNALCLGYSKTRRGSGTGPEWAKTLTKNIRTIIAKGITHISHFEELGIFCEGIGPDRLSDMTANLLKNRLVTYTQRICNLHNVPMKRVYLQNANFDYEYLRWWGGECLLPTNPYKNNSPILLVPKNFLNILPEINSDDFSETIHLAERLRNDFNYEVDKNLDKEKIAQIAIENYDLVKEYIDIVEKREAKSFGELMKKTLRYMWYELSKEVVNNNKFVFGDVPDDTAFIEKINDFIKYYKDFIELRSGYKLLWNDTKTTPRSEEDVQLLLKGILDEHCRANNIDLTREVNQGMGPVDFRFSCGYSNRMLLEAKLAKNTKFWNGLKVQLPQYMKIDSCKKGIFLVIVYSDKDIKRIKDIQEINRDVCRHHNVDIKIVVVDARISNKESASKNKNFN